MEYLMMTVHIWLVIAAIGVAAITALQAPPLVVVGIAAFIRRCIDREIAADVELLVAPRVLPADRWAPPSRADRRLLAHSLSLSVRRTVLASGLPRQAA